MRQLIILCFLITNFMSTNLAAQTILDLLPPVPDGWEIAGEDKIYTPDDLYDYIDGGAELFLSYNMKEVASRTIRFDKDEIRIEIFDMNSSENAFGVFSHTRTQNEGNFGQGSQQFTGTLIFWKSHYYITLTANDDNQEIQLAFEIMASDIEQQISEEGKLPDLVSILPTDKLLKDGYVYFHHPIWQNSYHYISSDNIFDIADNTPAILAKYGAKEQRYYLLIIHYPDKEKCDSALVSYLEKFGNTETDEMPVMLEDSTWWNAASEGTYFIVVMNAPEEKSAKELLNKTEKSIKSASK